MYVLKSKKVSNFKTLANIFYDKDFIEVLYDTYVLFVILYYMELGGIDSLYNTQTEVYHCDRIEY